MKKILFIATFLMAFTMLTASTSATQVLFVANCDESITLRKSPSIDSNEITQIPLGQGLAIIGEAENGFYKVIYGRNSGYVLADYLSDEAPDNLRLGMLIKRATLFESASTHSEKIAEIISGHWVEYIDDAYFASYPDEGPDFYLVRFGSTYGYITADKVD